MQNEIQRTAAGVPREISAANDVLFFAGMHQPAQAGMLVRAFVSDNRIKTRKKPFDVKSWILDSGAFSKIELHGRYLPDDSAPNYAARIRRWANNGRLLAAVAQDFMCELRPHRKGALSPLARTNATNVALRVRGRGFYGPATADELIYVHQRWTVRRYDRLMAEDTGGVYIMPVLQGFTPQQYVRHILMYGARLRAGAWVGVGSVCKRNGSPRAVEEVLITIKSARPDLLLHGFGVKTTALASGLVRQLLATADSMAWSFAARFEGGDANSAAAAIAFADRIEAMGYQFDLMGLTLRATA